MTKGEKLVALLRSIAGQWYYTNDWWARMNPEESGGSDCSGTARWAYSKFGYDIGTWTGDESHAGYEIARGHYPSEIPWDIMKPGDLILMTATYWNNYEFDEYLCHVEIYCGGGTMIGHPGGYGPQEKWAQAWMEAYKCITWMVRRVFESEDDMEPVDVWAYKNKDVNGDKDAYKLLTDAAYTLTRTDNAGWASPKGHDIFGRVNAMQVDLAQIKKDIANIKVGGAEIDYDKLSDMVCDKMAARMKS